MKHRILSLAMIIILVILSLPTTILPVEAAYPAISRSNPIKAYLMPTDNNTVAYDPNNRSKSVGRIWSSDEVFIFELSDNGIIGSYPLDSGGRRDCYLPLSYLTNGKSLGHINGTATKQITTYRRASTSNTYGYVSAGDAVVKIDERNGFVQLIYPISGGFKCGYVKSSDYNANVKQASSATVTWNTNPTPNIPKTNASAPIVNGFKLADIPDGEVIMYYKDTFYCVDAQFGSKENGTKLILQLPNNGLNQKWFLQKSMMNDGTGRWFYTMESMNAPGKIVEVRNNGTHNGAEIAIWSNTGINNSQRWFIVENNGFYSLINVNSLSYMDADDGNIRNYNGQKIHQWQNMGGDTGKFRFQYVSGSAPSPAPAPTPIPAKTELQKAIDRAEEVVNFSWVPVKDFAGYRNRWTYKAGVRYYGLPYGQPTHDKQLLVTSGYTLEFFKQQVADSNSKLYTEKAGNYPGDKCPYYSVDCSAYVSYILNVSRFTTSSIITMANSSSNKDYYFTSYDNIKAGDILNVQGHMRWVYAVNGNNISYYEQRATDSASGATRKNTETKTSLQNAGYRVIRVAKING